MNTFKPILAATLMPSEIECNDTTVFAAMTLLKYPVLASVKMDGIRALRMEMPFLASRTLKWIPNEELCARALSLPIGYDMELWSPFLDYNKIQSIVMEEKANAERVEFYVIDCWNRIITYEEICDYLINKDVEDLNKTFFFTQPTFCNDAEKLFAFEKYCIEQHSEGICFRLPNSPYKQDRSTLKEQYLVKHCRFIYDECEIVGFIEQKENTNKIKYNAVGKMDRSKEQIGMIPKGTLGAFTVKNEHGVIFDVGTGQDLTNELRQEIWNHREEYLGKTVIIKSKAHGVKNKPRSPVFWGFRREGY